MRQWRVGTISMGLLLILLGILLLLNTITDINIKNVLYYGWPIILILLGLEVLFFSLIKKNERLKFSFFSVFIIFLAFSFTFLIYAIDEVGIIPSIEKAIDGESYTVDVNTSLNIPDNVTEISIEAPNGDFEIIGEKTDALDVTGTITMFTENKKEAQESLEDVYSVKIIGNQAIIRIEDTHNNYLWFGENNPRANLNITIPEDIFLEIDIVNGDININDILNSGNIENINGDININNSVGDFDVDMVNGKITSNNIKGKIVAKTTNGKISVDEIDGELNLKTTNGDIDVISSNVSNDWKVSTLNGKITLEIPSDVNAKLIAESDVSNVTGNIQWIEENNDDDYVGSEKEAILGNGEHRITLDTLSGKIEVYVK